MVAKQSHVLCTWMFTLVVIEIIRKHEIFDFSADDFFSAITEHLSHLLVDRYGIMRLIHSPKTFVSGLHKSFVLLVAFPKRFFGHLAVGDVTDHEMNHMPSIILLLQFRWLCCTNAFEMGKEHRTVFSIKPDIKALSRPVYKNPGNMLIPLLEILMTDEVFKTSPDQFFTWYPE